MSSFKTAEVIDLTLLEGKGNICLSRPKKPHPVNDSSSVSKKKKGNFFVKWKFRQGRKSKTNHLNKGTLRLNSTFCLLTLVEFLII